MKPDRDDAKALCVLVYLAVYAWFFWAEPDYPPDSILVPLWLGTSVLVGALIGRWWAIAVVVPWAIVALLGDVFNPCREGGTVHECLAWTPFVLLFLTPITALSLTVGVVIGRVGRRARL